MNESYLVSQIMMCDKYDVPFFPSSDYFKVGVSNNVGKGILPINGLRHPPEGDTTGWYLWAGTDPMGTNPDYFQPIHVAHLPDLCPEILKFLGLPPGWRFLIALDYEDVWFDQNLIDVILK